MNSTLWRKILLTIAALALWRVACGEGREGENGGDYHYPILDVRGLHSASFGEMRTNHFHSGIDIKTEGVEGKTVVAAADGYVSRLVHSPSGYGLAIYITHPHLETMTVYGHLSRFRPDIAEAVRAERYATRCNRVDINIAPERFPVRRGEVIGYSGNSGTSFGPHLHFELRAADGERTLNVIRQGVCTPKDNTPPQMLVLDYIDIDTLEGVAVERMRRSFTLTRRGTEYTTDSEVEVGRCGYFVLRCRDRQNGTWNRYGIYRATVHVEQKTIFEYRMDGFRFADTRACNVVAYYPLQLNARCEAIRLSKVAGCPDEYYTALVAGGTVGAAPNERKNIIIEIEDDCGNISSAHIVARGRDDDERLPSAAHLRAQNSKVAGIARITTLACKGGTVGVPATALYEPAFCSIIRRNDRCDANDSIEGVESLSAEYRVLSPTTPLRSSIGVHITADIPVAMMRQVCIARRNSKGGWAYEGGHYAAGGGYIAARNAGDMAVVADVAPPKIEPLFADCPDTRLHTEIRFRVSDNFSGIDTYTLHIDGEWIAVDFSPVKGIMAHKFEGHSTNGSRRHTAELRITDRCGNTATWRGEFVR